MGSILDRLSNLDKEAFKTKMEKPFIFLLLLLCVVAIACLDIPPLVKTIRAQSWPTVQGTVVHYDVVHMELGKEPAWTPLIEYSYRVGDAPYKGTELRFQRYYGLGGYEAFSMKDKYVDNAPVIVHYNPSNPYVSVIQTTPSLWKVVYNFICCLLWAALIYFSTYPRVGPEAPVPAHLLPSEEPADNNSDVQEPVPAS
jgi:hypothetical protein